MTLTVAKLASRAGVTPHTIRYYERAGLLPAPARSAAGYRLYEEDLLDRLRLIRGARRTGFRLRQIRELLEVIDRGACPCGHAAALLSKRVAEIDREIRDLEGAREHLIALGSRLRAREAGDPEPWPCERALIEAGTEGGAHGEATG